MSVKTVLLAALSQYRGDDLERARRSFQTCTHAMMQQQFGQSGRTRAEILAEYEEQAAKVDEARQWVERMLP